MDNSFNKRKALDYLLKQAYEMNISQSKLCEGVYDYSHFNRMCNGKEKIKIDVLLLCAQNVSIPVEEIWNSGIHTNQQIINDFFDYMRHFQLDKIQQIYMYLSQQDLYDDPYLRQLQHYIAAIFQMINKQYNNAKDEIISGIRCIHMDFEMSQTKKWIFSKLEKYMLIDLMTLYRFFHEYDCALMIYDIVKLSNKSYYFNAVLVSTISPVMRAIHDLENDIKILKDVINECEKHYDIRQLAICYIELAHCYLDIGKENECEQCLIKAKKIYSMTNQIDEFYNEKGLNYVCIQRDDPLFKFHNIFQFDLMDYRI